MLFLDFSRLGDFRTLHCSRILETNSKAQKYGLSLTPDEALEIIEERNLALKRLGRVELDIEVTRKLIDTVCSSPYLTQDNYASTITGLQEVFYFLKNETEDSYGDEELIDIIVESFDHSCQGSIELVQGKGVDSIIRAFRFQKSAIIREDREEDEF